MSCRWWEPPTPRRASSLQQGTIFAATMTSQGNRPWWFFAAWATRPFRNLKPMNSPWPWCQIPWIREISIHEEINHRPQPLGRKKSIDHLPKGTTHQLPRSEESQQIWRHKLSLALRQRRIRRCRSTDGETLFQNTIAATTSLISLGKTKPKKKKRNKRTAQVAKTLMLDYILHRGLQWVMLVPFGYFAL